MPHSAWDDLTLSVTVSEVTFVMELVVFHNKQGPRLLTTLPCGDWVSRPLAALPSLFAHARDASLGISNQRASLNIHSLSGGSLQRETRSPPSFCKYERTSKLGCIIARLEVDRTNICSMHIYAMSQACFDPASSDTRLNIDPASTSLHGYGLSASSQPSTSRSGRLTIRYTIPF